MYNCSAVAAYHDGVGAAGELIEFHIDIKHNAYYVNVTRTNNPPSPGKASKCFYT